jgi:phage/plasmid-like protein (TIGR03299 family)
MSTETLQHLNTQTLIGMTSQRGNAWHYRAEHQGEETNHYDAAIPVEDVERRLFNWTAMSRRIAVETPADLDQMSHLDPLGSPAQWIQVDDRQAITRSDTNAVLGIFGTGYAMHQYWEWLLGTVANILDDDLVISSAGLLRGGAIAWVEVSVPETITTPVGFAFRPNLLATTSFDGSIASTFKRTVTATVCDNTRAAALAEKGQEYRVKHTKYSQAKITAAREALAVVHTMGEAFAHELEILANTPVTDDQWRTFLDRSVPLDDCKGHLLEGRARTMATRKRGELEHLYRLDHRAAPWTGTALGVLQATNTWAHHFATSRGATRKERNLLNAVSGATANGDLAMAALLGQVLDG